MRGVLAGLLSLSACLLLLGCADPNVSPIKIQFGESNALVMGGNLRMVTERTREIPGLRNFPTVCTEPSPDVAIAFGKSLAVEASVTQTDGPSGSGKGSYSSTETASLLAGRTAGVLALRDGLYAACQAYTNGVIGHNAYALIMSQYGNLLVALAGTGPATSTAYSQQDAAAAALLVGCISEYDPTRLGALTTRGGAYVRDTNPLLSRRFCTTLLNNVARGRPVHVASSKK